jgi:hypothetical protein
MCGRVRLDKQGQSWIFGYIRYLNEIFIFDRRQPPRFCHRVTFRLLLAPVQQIQKSASLSCGMEIEGVWEGDTVQRQIAPIT